MLSLHPSGHAPVSYTHLDVYKRQALATPDDADIEKVRERADEMMYHNKKVLKGLI